MPTVTQPQPKTQPESTLPNQPDDGPALRIRYRVRFAKTGLLRWISHRDLARLWERLIRRAELKPSMTEGFHPKPRIGFPSALALGVESLDEVVELDLAEDLTPAELLVRLQQDDQPGLTIASVAKLPEQSGKAQLQRSDYLITTIDGVDDASIGDAIEKLCTSDSVSVERKKKTMTVKVAEQIAELKHGDGQLHLSLAASDSASLRPSDVLDLLGFDDWIEKGSLIRRVRVVLKQEFQSDDASQMVVADPLPVGDRRTPPPIENPPFHNSTASVPQTEQKEPNEPH